MEGPTRTPLRESPPVPLGAVEPFHGPPGHPGRSGQPGQLDPAALAGQADSAEQPEDAALVERARRGDTSAYGVLVHRHEAHCFRTAYAILHDAEEARDATQDALIKAYYHLDRFRPGAPFRPWVLKIAANEARNRRIAVGRRHALARRAAEEAAPSSATTGASPDGIAPDPIAPDTPLDGSLNSSLDASLEASPEAALLARERREAIIAAVNALRHEDRLAIASRYFLDLSEAEMAETLGWARGTVKSRLSRALVRLRHRLIAAAVLALLLTLALLAEPRTRAAIADRLGLLGIRIVRVPAGTPLPDAPPAPAAPAAPGAPAAPATGQTVPDATREDASSLGQRLRLGQPVTLEDARRRATFPVLTPSGHPIGAPDHVFYTTTMPGGQVSFIYRSRPGWQPARQTGAALLVSQFRGTMDADFYFKMVGPQARLETLTVNGGRAVWMEGAPHGVMVRTPDGRILLDEARAAANVLAWEQDGITVRLEGAMDRPTALTLAATFR